MRIAEKTDGLGLLLTAMNYTTVGHEFNDTESTEYIK